MDSGQWIVGAFVGEFCREGTAVARLARRARRKEVVVGDRIKVVYSGENLRVEYDVNRGEVLWKGPEEESGWVGDREAARGALALAEFLVSCYMGR